MHIDWASLAEVAIIAAAATATVVLLVTFALIGLSARGEQQPDSGYEASSPVRAATGTAVAVLCLLAAGLVVGYGLYVIGA